MVKPVIFILGISALPLAQKLKAELNGEIHTPTPDCFLDGITRRTVIDLAKKRQIKINERKIMPDELAGFEQCFIVGTAAEVTPVGEIGPWNFTVGDMVKTLREDYMKEVQPKAA